MTKICWWIVCLQIIIFPLYGQVVEINSEKDLFIIGKQLSFYEDETAKLTIQQILSIDAQKKFHLHEKDIFAHSSTNSVFWFRFQTKNNSVADTWLNINTTYLWEIDIYTLDDEGKPQEPLRVGSLRPDENKPYPTNTYWIPLQKRGQNVVKTFYIRAQTGRTFEVPLEIGTLLSLEKQKDHSDMLTAGFVGGVLLMFLYNVFLGIATKNKLYVFYTFYLLGALFSVTFSNNYPFLFKALSYPDLYHWLQTHMITWIATIQIPAGLITIYYLDLFKYRWLLITMVSILVAIGLVMVLNLFFPLYTLQTIHQSLLMLQSSASLLISYWLTFRKKKNALIYTLGWTTLMLSVFVYLGTINGLLPYNPYTRNSLYFGVAFEVWFFSLALGDHIRKLRKENQTAQQKLLEKARLEIDMRNQIIENQAKLEKANSQSLKLRVISKERQILRDIIDNLPIFVAMLDTKGNYLVANKRYEEAFFIPVEYIEDKHFSYILPEFLKKTHKHLIERAAKGEIVEFSEPVRLPNGIINYSYGKYFPVFDKHGKVERITVFVTDISEQKEKEFRLQKLNETKDKLFSIISHDLRSPFAQLKGILAIVEHGGISEAELKHFLPEIIRNVNYSSELLNNLVYWAKSQMSGLQADPEPFDISKLIANKANLFEKEISKKELLYENRVPKNTLVFADENMVDLVIRNLIANAIKFCQKADSILIEAEYKQDERLTIHIIDTGLGIAPENIPKLFGVENFTTLGTHKEKGTGLGLSLCKEFIEINKGKIWVESEEGKGSVFSFSLPTHKILLP